jgi:hypothetical protein
VLRTHARTHARKCARRSAERQVLGPLTQRGTMPGGIPCRLGYPALWGRPHHVGYLSLRSLMLSRSEAPAMSSSRSHSSTRQNRGVGPSSAGACSATHTRRTTRNSAAARAWQRHR